MKLTLLSAFAAVLTLTCISAQAQTNTAPAATMSSGTTSTTTTTADMKKIPYKGTITAVDATGMTVTVKGAKDTMMMKVDTDTKFKGGKSLTDFAVGDMVTGSYMKDASGAMTAHSLHKKPMK